MNSLADDLIAQLDQELKLGLTQNLHRSSFARGLETDSSKEGIVDRNTKTIYGVAVATEGPALGHGMDLDQTFLDQVVEAGNGAKQGIKARFDHPNASSTSMGKAIGRFKSFRKAGSVVRADLHLLKSASKSPDGDLPEYLMELATEDPASFGTSVVFSGDAEHRLDEEGQPLKGPDGKVMNPVARLTKLFAADVVDEPAANPSGLFHSMAEGSLAAKITSFLDKYFAHKGLAVESSAPPASSQPKETVMDKPVTATLTALDPTDILKAERARMFSILKYGRKLGVPDEKLEALMEKDLPLDHILMSLIDDAETRQFFNQKTALSLIETAPNPSAGGPGDPGAVTMSADHKPKAAVDLEAMTDDEREEYWKAEFAASPALKAEFMEFDIYNAFKKNEHHSRILRGAVERE